MKPNPILLGVNLDHVATLRQARMTTYPDPLEALFIAEKAGADGITLHLREDRRHIQPHDVERIQAALQTRLNLELAVTKEMIAFTQTIHPAHCCFVPEKREEITTEGGLNVLADEVRITDVVSELQAQDIEVSLFIDPDLEQIESAKRTGAKAIEIHTGAYADATGDAQLAELKRIVRAVDFANEVGLIVNAGHGLNCDNVAPIASIASINELNIGHAIIARALFIGFYAAIVEIKAIMLAARSGN